jgi:hypothetical protein
MTLATAASTPGIWDVAENQTVPYILGIAHPTGFPAFTLAGWIFSHVVAIGTVAWRLNLFSGLWVSAAVGGVALLAQVLGAGPTEAALAALAFAFGKQALFQGSHADVHAMLLACTTYGLFFALRYGRYGIRRDLHLAALCTGIGLATHPQALFVIPALAIVMAMRRKGFRSDTPLAAAALVAPLLLYLYFPLRSMYIAAHGLDPTAAAPIFGAGTVAWDTEHPRTLAGFIAEVTGQQFNAANRLVGSFAPQRFVPDLHKTWSFVPSELPRWVVPLGALGALAVAIRDLRLLVAALAMPACTVVFTAAVFTDPGDIARYLLPAFAVVVALAAAAAQLPLPGVPAGIRRFAVTVLLAAAVATAPNGAPAVHGIRDRDNGQTVIDLVRTSVPDGAIVVAAWPDATALAYGAFVEHALGSRTIVLGWPGNFVTAYPAWTRVRRTVILANLYGMIDISRSSLPRTWLRSLPSPNVRYHLYEIVPDR